MRDQSIYFDFSPRRGARRLPADSAARARILFL
jgi:hypothetical protein